MKDYYKTLEIEFGADIQTIKKAYRRLALKFHPDINKEMEAPKKFIEITEAYEVLGNENKRRQYDYLFSEYSKKVKFETEDIKTEKSTEWSSNGKKRAEEYASMKYEDFAERIIDELQLGISYTPNVIFILLCGLGAVFSLFAMLKINVMIGLVTMLIYGTVCYFLFERAKKDYIAERRLKILNKYK